MPYKKVRERRDLLLSRGFRFKGSKRALFDENGSMNRKDREAQLKKTF